MLNIGFSKADGLPRQAIYVKLFGQLIFILFDGFGPAQPQVSGN